MSGNPRVVAVDTTFTWDHAPQRLARGTVIDVPARSALEKAIGAGNLVPLRAVTEQPSPAVQEPPEVPAAAGETAPVPAARQRRNGAKAAAQNGSSSDGSA